MADKEKKETVETAAAEETPKADKTDKASKADKAEKAKKDKKAEKKKNKKPGIFARALKWFKELKGELKKVQWPTRKTVINNTIIVIVCVVVVGIVIGAFDFIAGSCIEAIMVLLR